jgi:hypothetical protein
MLLLYTRYLHAWRTCRRLSDFAWRLRSLSPGPSRSPNSISTVNRRSQTSELACFRPRVHPVARHFPLPSCGLLRVTERSYPVLLGHLWLYTPRSLRSSASQKTTPRPLDATRPLRPHHRPRTRSRHHGPAPQALVFERTENLPRAIRHILRHRDPDSGPPRRPLDCRPM